MHGQLVPGRAQKLGAGKSEEHRIVALAAHALQHLPVREVVGAATLQSVIYALRIHLHPVQMR